MRRFMWRAFSAITWSKRSQWQDSTNRSATPFCQGLRMAIRIGLTPRFFAVSTTSPWEGVLAIKYEKLRSGIVGEGLSKLLRYPCCIRVQCDIPVKNTPPIMSNHEEATQHAERERRHGEEIHRCSGFAMVAQEHRPSLGWLRVSWSFPHPSKHGPFRNVEAQHSDFPMDPRRAPGAVLGQQAKDQFPQFLARRFPTHYGVFAGNPFPMQFESGSTPADDGVWLDKDQCLSPSRPQPPQSVPKESVRSRKSLLRIAVRHNRELLP